jgi:hypothetical protein
MPKAIESKDSSPAINNNLPGETVPRENWLTMQRPILEKKVAVISLHQELDPKKATEEIYTEKYGKPDIVLIHGPKQFEAPPVIAQPVEMPKEKQRSLLKRIWDKLFF